MSGPLLSRATSLNIFVWAVAALAALVLVLAVAVPQRSIEWAWWGAVMLLISMRVAEAGSVEITRDSDEAGTESRLPPSRNSRARSCCLHRWRPCSAGVGMFVDELNAHSPPSRLAFNVGSTVLSVGAAALTASLLGISGAGLGAVGWNGAASFLAVAACYYVVNSLPVACVGAIASGRSIRLALLRTARTTAPTEFGLALLGGLAAFIWVINPYWLLVGASPAIISQLSLRYIAERNRKTAQLSALERLGRQLAAGQSVGEVSTP